MRLQHTLIALPFFATLFACTAAQDKGPYAKPASSEPTEVADPMANFARMVGGEWKVTFASGTSMYDTYHWGPGKHSGREMTHGEDAAGNPWRGLGVVYWHPGRKQLYSLGLNPYEGSVSEGPVNSEVAGDTTETVSDLYQNGAPPIHRKLVSRTTFDGPDKYHSALLEEVEPGKLMPLTEWDYFRSKTLTPVQPLPAENPPKPSERLKALEPLLGHTWDAKGTWSTAGSASDLGSDFHIESTFEWIPYIDAIYARSFALRGNGEPTHVLDAYFYYHTGTNKLRCLALSDWGGRSGVYEGDITVLDGGSVQLDLKGYEGDEVDSQVVRFDFEKDGTLHHRVWSRGGGGEDAAGGGEHTLMLDVRHAASEMSKGIWYVFQDAKDNYWFGSDGQGLYRYDGKAITHFTTKDGLCNDRIRGIQQHGPTGDILISTLDGVSKFDGQKFVTLPVTVMDSSDKGWVLDPHDVWLPWQPGQNGPYRYDGKTLYHLKFPKHPREDEFYATHPLARPWSPYEVYCVYKDRKGHIWFGTASFGICRFDGQHLDWMYEDHLTQIEGGGMFGIRSIIEDKDGAFWFCNTQFRYKIDPHATTEHGNGQITYTREKGMDLSGTSLQEKFFYFMSITEDKNGDLWMATWGGGVWRYDEKNITHYPVKDGDKDVTLFSISKDNRGDLWLGTHEAGPYKFNGKAFEKFAPPPPAPAPPPGGSASEPANRDPYFTPIGAKTTSFMPQVIIRNIREDRAGNIWFATFGGPIRYDGKTFTNFGEEVGLAKTRIFSLTEDRSGALWFGSITGGASRYDGKTFTKFTDKDGLGNNDVTWLFEDRDGNIWFGTGNGASRYDGKSMTNFTTKDGLIDNSVYAITQDASGRMWFGTQGGVCSYDGKSFTDLADKVGRSFVNVRALAVDRSGNLWFGGQGGAFRYDGKNLTTFTTEEGLLDLFVGSMIVDRAGNVWMGHPGQGREGGASRYDGKSFKRFTQKDGLNSTNVYCMLEDTAGNIWFGSVDAGACRYDGKTFTNFSVITPIPLPAQIEPE